MVKQFLYSRINHYCEFLQVEYPELDIIEIVNKFKLLNWNNYENYIVDKDRKNMLNFHEITKKILKNDIIVNEYTNLLFL